jgi:hypothetical protein
MAAQGGAVCYVAVPVRLAPPPAEGTALDSQAPRVQRTIVHHVVK